MTTPMEKGNVLEEAVKAIEHAILQSSSGLEKDSFLIESKKIVIIDGVRHEIDVWAEIDHGKDYKSIFIFECKNWESSVGKNEIIIFSEKIDVVQAQKGFFVAKSFTKDAKAQAKKDKRITLLNATEYAVENIPMPFNFHFIEKKDEHGDLTVEEKSHKNKKINKKRKLNLDRVKCILNNEEVNMTAYAQKWIKDCADNRLRSFPSANKEDGIYELDTDDLREFKDGELFIDDKEIERLKLKVTFKVRVVRPGIVSHYEVETRGRILSLAPIQVGDDGQIQMSLIGTDNA
ncbi:MAG: restriction endonuclease [Methylococcales bacterium]